MAVFGVHQVTLRAPRDSAKVKAWSLPAYGIVMRSFSVMQGTGEDLVIIKPRIAEALNIQDGDEVTFQFDEAQTETFTLQVKVRDDLKYPLNCDVIIHDFIKLGLATGFEMDSFGERVILKSGKVLIGTAQEMWAGMKIFQRKGSARLYFDGACRNNPKGPCGYGFHIVNGTYTAVIEELIRFSGYAGMSKSSNEMEYHALIEGLTWATRLQLERLTVFGDSDLIIRQVKGEYSVNNPRLKVLHRKVMALLESHKDMKVTFQRIPREENQIADSLATQGIDTKVNITRCNWPNINKLMARHF